MLRSSDVGPLPAVQGCVSERLELRVYRALTSLARPAAPYILRHRERQGKEDPARRGERLGRASLARPDGPLVWVHAASVGETGAVLPLISRLVERNSALSVLLTTGTVTSAGFAAARLPPRTLHQYVPLDCPAFVGSFLDHWRPQLGVFTEQEVWPNLVLEAGRRGVPMALVNARMSDASFDRWQRRSGLAGALFSRFSVVLAQNERLAERFRALGAARALAAGNLKVDAPAPPVDPAAYARLDAALAGRPRLVAASTHEGEEMALSVAHLSLKREMPGLVTIIAPRHPDRGTAIAEAMARQGLSVGLRAQGALPDAGTDIYIADTIGELGTLYALTPLAFVGGSLVPHGGQNPIEAIRHDAAVVAGPFTHNFADAFSTLAAAGGTEIVPEADALGPVLGGLLCDHDRLARMRAAANRALETLSGALDRTTDALLPFLSDATTKEAGKRAG